MGDAEAAVGADVDLVQGDLPLDKLGKIWDLPLLRATLAYMFGLEELPNPSGALGCARCTRAGGFCVGMAS
jgi:hypothetical protein